MHKQINQLDKTNKLMNKNDTILIRLYKTEDKDKLIEILQRNTPQYFAYEETNDFVEYLDKEIEYYFVIECNNSIVGSGGINTSEDKLSAKISWDIISPYYQNKGLGKKLLQYRIQYIHDTLNLSHITVRTSQYAFQFYEKNRFTLINVQKDYWAIGYDLYEMIYK